MQVAPAAAAAAGEKRKRIMEQKYYAVHKGKTPGIYIHWNQCKAQITGYKGAVFKAFTSQRDAQTFVESGLTPRQSSKGPQKYYAVQSGRIPGVYLTWEEASAQITGQTKPRYKSFLTRGEAEAFVREGEDDSLIELKGPSAKKRKKSGKESGSGDENDHHGPGEGPPPLDAEDDFDPSIHLSTITGKLEYKSDNELQATKLQANGLSDDGMLRIWTDGSSRGNGTANAIAGVGVYFGPKDKRNIAEPLAGPRQTNQRAELTAILRALELAPRDRPVTILSDSEYAINCVTKWFQKWRQNEWRNAAGRAVENKDLIEKILAYIEERERINDIYRNVDVPDGAHETPKALSWKRGRARVQFVWVKGHASEPGNVAADALAVAGATGFGAEQV